MEKAVEVLSLAWMAVSYCSLGQLQHHDPTLGNSLLLAPSCREYCLK